MMPPKWRRTEWPRRIDAGPIAAGPNWRRPILTPSIMTPGTFDAIYTKKNLKPDTFCASWNRMSTVKPAYGGNLSILHHLQLKWFKTLSVEFYIQAFNHYALSIIHNALLWQFNARNFLNGVQLSSASKQRRQPVPGVKTSRHQSFTAANDLRRENNLASVCCGR